MKFKKWAAACPDRAAVETLAATGLSTLAAMVLCARGLDVPDLAWDFLSAGKTPLPDPFLLKDMDRAALRIGTALEQGEQIAVYGDYDVDGITATCLLTRFLRGRGGNVISYIPDRMEEGYGLNVDAVEHLAAQGVTLIITVDCGITAVEEVCRAAELGVSVIITDHHECKEALPQAAAVVDPRRQDCPYPFKCLAGVGVALKLVLALSPVGERMAVLEEYADLAAVGTVADVMHLTGENRAVVVQGLESLNRTPRPGFKALIHEAGVEGRAATATGIGFALAPRLNAAGRMGKAMAAAELLLTDLPSEAAQRAIELCSLNRERQRIEGEIYDTCIASLEREKQGPQRAIVLAGENWHQGVVGIVASRLAERCACPVFIICLQDGKGKGSCRSFGGFNLLNALEGCQDILEGFGGHALAAGFTILAQHISAFRSHMEQAVETWTGGAELSSLLELDAELTGGELLTVSEVEGLEILEPHGAGNPKPVFSLHGCTVTSTTEVGGGRHLKLKLNKNGQNLDSIYFSAADCARALTSGDRIDVAFTPQINEFRGNRTVQLLVCDLRPAQTRVEAECALYERLRRGEELSSEEAALLIPSRGEFAAVWRYLNTHARSAPVEDTARRLAKMVARTYGTKETVMRTMVCLDVLDERGLVRLERCTDHLRISLCPSEGKVDLEQSCWMQRLRLLAGE